MDISRLRKGEQIAAAGGVALFIVMFLGWYGVKASVSGITQSGPSANAWEVFSLIDIVLFATAVVAVGLAVLTATQRTVNLPVAASAITAALGILSLALVLYRVIDPPGTGGDFLGAEVDITRKIGLFLGLIATGAIAAGGWLSMQDEGTTFGQAREQLADAVSGGETAPPPPPEAGAPPAEPAPPVEPPPPGEGGSPGSAG